jgi:glucose-6-phosphate dehydrogenase assembly protein OpcA
MNSTDSTFPITKNNWTDKKQTGSLINRACLFNLIIYTNESRRASYFLDIVRLITAKFPCRIIFIWSDDSAKEPYIRVRQALDSNEGGLHSNSDQFLIEASKERLDRVPIIILPYLVPDLPIYLFWGQDPTTENTILPHLQKYATRLIFDSESCDNLKLFSQNMITRSESSPIEITDMNWARIGSWRDVLAQAFDTQERIEQLSSSKQITITYNDRPSDISLHPTTQALYLQAWLASQLKWEFDKWEKEGRSIRVYYRSGKNLIKVILQGETRLDIQAQEILKFEAEDPANFSLSLTLKSDNQVIVHCNTIDRCELPFTVFLPSLWSGKNFIQEIFYKKTSNQYFRMLRYISWINNR